MSTYSLQIEIYELRNGSSHGISPSSLHPSPVGNPFRCGRRYPDPTYPVPSIELNLSVLSLQVSIISMSHKEKIIV